MPTYQYACTACGHELEAVQSFSDDPLTECPACQGRLRKLFGSVGVVFKGPGFYRTDSRASSNGAGAKSNGAAKTDGTSTGKTDGSGSSDNSSSKGSGKGSSGDKSSSSKDKAATSS